MPSTGKEAPPLALDPFGGVDDKAKSAMFATWTVGPGEKKELVQKRVQAIQELVDQCKENEPKLKSKLEPPVARVLKDRNLIAFKKVLSDIKYKVQKVCSGTSSMECL